MKHLNFAAVCGIALLGTVVTLSSCSEEAMDSENETVYAPVSVQISDFSMSVNEFPNPSGTRATESPASYLGVKALTLAFYASDGTEMYKTTQLKSDNTTFTTFGQFSCELPVGSYTLVVVGRDVFDGDVFTLTSATVAAYTSEWPRETFAGTQNVTVTSANPLNLSITLNRINTMLIISSTDLLPAGVAKLRTTYSAGCKGFNPSTGLATNTNGFSVTNNIPESRVGKTVSIANNAFLGTDDQTMDITLEALDAENNVLCTKIVENVPLKRNRQTTLQGHVFTPSTASQAAFTLETGWIEGNSVDF